MINIVWFIKLHTKCSVPACTFFRYTFFWCHLTWHVKCVCFFTAGLDGWMNRNVCVYMFCFLFLFLSASISLFSLHFAKNIKPCLQLKWRDWWWAWGRSSRYSKRPMSTIMFIMARDRENHRKIVTLDG